MKKFISILLGLLLLLSSLTPMAFAEDADNTKVYAQPTDQSIDVTDSASYADLNTNRWTAVKIQCIRQTSLGTFTVPDEIAQKTIVFHEVTVQSEEAFMFFRIFPRIGASNSAANDTKTAPVEISSAGELKVINSSKETAASKQLTLGTAYKLGLRYDFRGGKKLLSVYVDEELLISDVELALGDGTADNRQYYGFRAEAYPYYGDTANADGSYPITRGKIHVTAHSIMTGNPYDPLDIWDFSMPEALIAPPDGVLARNAYTAKVNGEQATVTITCEGEAVNGIAVDNNDIIVYPYAAGDSVKTLDVLISNGDYSLSRTIKLYPSISEDFENPDEFATNNTKEKAHYTMIANGKIEERGGNHYALASGTYAASTRFIPTEAITSKYGLVTFETKGATIPKFADSGLAEIGFISNTAKPNGGELSKEEFLLGVGGKWGIRNLAKSTTDDNYYEDNVTLRPTADTKYNSYLLATAAGNPGANRNAMSYNLENNPSYYTTLASDVSAYEFVPYKAEIDLENGTFDFYCNGEQKADDYKLSTYAAKNEIATILWGTASDDFAIYTGRGEALAESVDVSVSASSEGAAVENTFTKGEFVATATLNNNTKEAKTFTVVAAQYRAGDDGINELIAVSTSLGTSVAKYSTAAAETKLEITDAGGTFVKVMVLENMTGIRPLTEIKTYTPSATVVLMGDSVCQTYTGDIAEKGIQGWGKYISASFDSAVSVNNTAKSGWSTKNYLGQIEDQSKKEGEQWWEDIEPTLKNGDYLIIALGINDASYTGAGKTTEEEFTANMTQFITEAKAKGAEVILVSPTIGGGSPDSSDDWIYDETHPWVIRGNLIKKIAEEASVVYLPLGETLVTVYNDMKAQQMTDGKTELEAANYVRHNFHLYSPDYDEYLAAYQSGKEYDGTHFNTNGAQQLSEIIAELIADSDSSLKYFIK